MEFTAAMTVLRPPASSLYCSFWVFLMDSSVSVLPIEFARRRDDAPFWFLVFLFATFSRSSRSSWFNLEAFESLLPNTDLNSGLPPGMVSMSLTLVFSEVDSSPRAPPAVLAGELGLGAKLVEFDLSGGTVGRPVLITGCTAFGSPLISLKFAVSVRK